MVRLHLFLTYSFALTLILLLSACAEVMPLSGGNRDETAPRVNTAKSTPENGSVGITVQELKLVFDEFIVVNEPQTTISIQPSLGTIETEKGTKSLLVRWEKVPEQNTTYIVSLNGTIRDNNENNDTIIQWVFSTGLAIDSGNFKGIVADAFQGMGLGNITVGFWPVTANPLKDAPIYASRSEKNGKFELNYLKAGEYQLFAFEDQNKNQLCDVNEKRGFHASSITIPSVDTNRLELQLFQPLTTRNELKYRIEKPGAIVVTGAQITNPLPTVNGESNVLSKWGEDSVRLAIPSSSFESLKIIHNTDTLTSFYKFKDRSKNFKIQPSSSLNCRKGDTLYFSVNEKIVEFNEELIQLKGTGSVTSGFSENTCWIVPKVTDDFTLQFKPGALKGAINQNDSLSLKVAYFESADLSNLLVKTATFDSTWLIQVIDPSLPEGKTVVNSGRFNNGKLAFNGLIPATYVLRCIEDTNGNNRWDTGSFEEKKLPERIVRFSITQKLRPNWDIEQLIDL